MAASRPIVHPTDFSSASRPAFAEAIAMAKLKKAPLVIVHVLPSLPIVPDAYVPPKTIVDLERAQQEHGKHELDRVVAKAKAARVPASGVLLEAGTPADQIVGVAKSKPADMN